MYPAPDRPRPAIRFRRWPFLALVCAVAISRAWAHDPFASWTILRVGPTTIEATTTMNAEAAWPLIQTETNTTAELDPRSFDGTARPLLLKFAATLLELGVDGSRVEPVTTDVRLAEGNLEFHFTYPRPPHGMLSFNDRFVSRMPEGSMSHVTILDAERRQLAEEPIDPGYSSIEVPLPIDGRPPAAPRESALMVFRKFLKLGIEHILSGYDHLLFLCGLLIACRRLSTALTIITCFTIAHSITLALAALDVFSLPSRVVEPLIAASIVFVGVENLLRRDEPPARWALTLAFGLIHGFGFAAVLKEIGLGGGGVSIAVPLFSFNLGVEIGQLSIALVALPIIWAVQRDARFSRRATAVASVLVTLAGSYWLLQRTLFS